MSKKAVQTENLARKLAVGAMLLLVLPVLVYFSTQKTPSSDALAAAAGQKVSCPAGFRPSVACPDETRDPSYRKTMAERYRANPTTMPFPCNWQCVPVPSTQPRPSVVPPGKTTPTWYPLPSVMPTGFCPIDVVCPLNCPMTVSSVGCPVCRCLDPQN